MTRRPLIAGNWKLHNDLAASVALARSVVAGVGAGARAEVVIAPVFTALAHVRDVVKGSAVTNVGLEQLSFAGTGSNAVSVISS